MDIRRRESRGLTSGKWEKNEWAIRESLASF